ncbi:MAG TPA: inorganic phosphate transporter, partial [Nitrospiria bacterium]
VVRKLMKDWKGHCFCLLPTRKARLALDHSGFVRMIPGETEIRTIMDDPACDTSSVLSLRIGPDTFHWITSGLTSLARGMNDAPKMVAMLVGLSLVSGGDGQTLLGPGFLLVAAGMAAGSVIGGRRVTQFLAKRVTKMDHLEGFAANLATSILVSFASRLGFPVSTTHLSSSAIIGIGLRRGVGGVHWKPVSEMLLAWVVTLPVSGLIAGGIYGLIKDWV